MCKSSSNPQEDFSAYPGSGREVQSQRVQSIRVLLSHNKELSPSPGRVVILLPHRLAGVIRLLGISLKVMMHHQR